MDGGVAKRYSDYFERVYSTCAEYSGAIRSQGDTSLCVVIHAFDNIFPYLETLRRHFHIAAVVFKGSREVHADIVELARERGFPVRTDLTREPLKRDDAIMQLMEDISASPRHRRLINLDYGGYLCDFHRKLSTHPEWRRRYLGVIEGTENGCKRYRNLLESWPPGHGEPVLRPIVSGARSLTKDCYDAHIGQSLVEGSAYALQHSGGRQLTAFRCFGVLGYGKIGRSTAFYLRKAVPDSRMIICEIDLERARLARLDGFDVVDIGTLVADADFIYSITGSAALTLREYDTIACSGKVIACGTSPDDELGLARLLEHGVLGFTQNAHFDRRGTCVSRTYSVRNGHTLELLGDGRTINTLMKSGSQHPTLALTEACYIAQIFSLLSGYRFRNDEVNSPDSDPERLIFELWRTHFADGKPLLDCMQWTMLNAETLMALREIERGSEQRAGAEVSDRLVT